MKSKIIVRGSQRRENYKDAGYKIIAVWSDGRALLEDETGKREQWQMNDHYAGYVIEISGVGYEFVRSA